MDAFTASERFRVSTWQKAQQYLTSSLDHVEYKHSTTLSSINALRRQLLFVIAVMDRAQAKIDRRHSRKKEVEEYSGAVLRKESNERESVRWYQKHMQRIETKLQQKRVIFKAEQKAAEVSVSGETDGVNVTRKWYLSL